ncbi:MAG TPA: aminotransferase class I/II-fold pyridoxal phosphate-dependent enzyme [Desulfobacteraceae bacterium]|nr:aminotransferase class I/II-fold pyridoxal phosphate-dependent enzyme [Desulfobacteraceae bacterium]
MNQIAQQLNQVIDKENPYILEMLSDIGKNIFFPKGILSQSAEAKEKAHKLNATIGIATEEGKTMCLDSAVAPVTDLQPDDFLTYAPSFGIPDLRKIWQNSLFEKNPSLVNKRISTPVVTCGITHAISVFADLWVNPGDTVILPDMMWGNYNLILGVRRGANISSYPLFTNEGGFNLPAFDKCINKEAKKGSKIIVLLNFPNNPTGYTVTEKEGDQIVSKLTNLAQKGTNVVVACDDAYFGLFYDEDSIKESLFARLCSRHSRLIPVKLDGATKELFVWGLRVGFITYGSSAGQNPLALYDALERKTAGCVRGSISNASRLSQLIVLKTMEDRKYLSEKKEKFEILKRRAGQVKKVLSNPRYKDFWDVYPFNSGYFMCIRLKSVNAETLRCHLLEKYGVGLISIGSDNLRIAFSCLEEKDIQTLFDTILQGVQDLAG